MRNIWRTLSFVFDFLCVFTMGNTYCFRSFVCSFAITLNFEKKNLFLFPSRVHCAYIYFLYKLSVDLHVNIFLFCSLSLPFSRLFAFHFRHVLFSLTLFFFWFRICRCTHVHDQLNIEKCQSGTSDSTKHLHTFTHTAKMHNWIIISQYIRTCNRQKEGEKKHTHMQSRERERENR